jgi:Big-like domain-containing protein
MPGTHVITATYAGDASFSPSPNPPSASQTLTLTITKGVVYPAIFSAGNGSNTINALLTFSAGLYNVSPAAVAPTGTVQFFDGATLLGQGMVVNGGGGIPQASLPAITLSQGPHQITVTYSGDTLYSSESTTQEFDNGVPIGWYATTTTQTINPGKTATYNLTLSTATGFTGQVRLSCIAGTDPFTAGTSPPGTQCTVSPSSVTFDAKTTSFPVVVTITTTVQSRLEPFPWETLPFAFAGVFVFGFRKNNKKRSKAALLTLAVAVLALVSLPSCGGGSTSTTPPPNLPPAATATFTVWSSYPFDPNETVYNGVVLTTNINP